VHGSAENGAVEEGELEDGELEDGEVEDGEVDDASNSSKRKLDDANGPRAHSEENTEKLERMLAKFAKQKSNLMKMQKKWNQKKTTTGSDAYLRDYDDVNYSYCIKRKIESDQE